MINNNKEEKGNGFEGAPIAAEGDDDGVFRSASKLCYSI